MPLILNAFGGVCHVLTCACHRYSYATLLLVDYRLSFLITERFFYFSTLSCFYHNVI